MEKKSRLAGGWINRSEIRAFKKIAITARQREVFQQGLATVLNGDDVVRLVGNNAILFMQSTVFTPSASTLPIGSPERRRDECATHLRPGDAIGPAL